MPTPGPMNPIQVQLFAGAAAGRRARFDRSPITFGRDPSNLLVVEDATVSRRHGEIRFENGMWVLVNQSENGTRVNRKAVTDKPAPLKTGDEVFVAGKLLFNVTIEAVEAAPAGEASITEQPAEAEAPKRGGAKKKLWIGISIYIGAMLLLVIFLSTLKKKGPAVEDNVPELTKEQIAEYIRQMPRREAKSELRYRESLSEANRRFSRRNTSLGGVYDAYAMYQTALSYSGRDDYTFPVDEPEAQLRFRQVQQELIDKFEAIYRDACNRLNRGDVQGAYDGFEKLKELFKDGNNPLMANVQEKENIAVKRKGRGKFKSK